MKHLYGGIAVWMALFLAAPGGNAARQESQAQGTSQGTSSSQPSQSQPAQTQTQAQPSQTQNQQAAPSDADQSPKGVKPGSEKDVNSIGNRGVGKGVNFFSLEKEMAIGKNFAQEIERTSKLINDPVVTEYVNRVGQNLVRNSDAKVPFTIKVIDSDEINAFALPGGFFYVNSGLILHADEEAEMAGVMGHEIAHVAARHWAKNQTKGEIAQFATIPLILLGPGGWAGYGLYEGLNIGMPLTFLKFTRDEEREADYLGLQYMYKAGYDPNAFISFFEKVEAEERRHPGTIPKIFSDHPPTPDRVVKAQEEVSTILPTRDEYLVTTSEFDIVKARLYRIENRNKLDNKKANTEKPTLRQKTEQQPPPDSTTGQQQPQSGQSGDDDPDRPKLKKRTDDSGTNNTN